MNIESAFAAIVSSLRSLARPDPTSGSGFLAVWEDDGTTVAPDDDSVVQLPADPTAATAKPTAVPDSAVPPATGPAPAGSGATNRQLPQTDVVLPLAPAATRLATMVVSETAPAPSASEVIMADDAAAPAPLDRPTLQPPTSLATPDTPSVSDLTPPAPWPAHLPARAQPAAMPPVASIPTRAAHTPLQRPSALLPTTALPDLAHAAEPGTIAPSAADAVVLAPPPQSGDGLLAYSTASRVWATSPNGQSRTAGDIAADDLRRPATLPGALSIPPDNGTARVQAVPTAKPPSDTRDMTGPAPAAATAGASRPHLFGPPSPLAVMPAQGEVDSAVPATDGSQPPNVAPDRVIDRWAGRITDPSRNVSGPERAAITSRQDHPRTTGRADLPAGDRDQPPMTAPAATKAPAPEPAVRPEHGTAPDGAPDTRVTALPASPSAPAESLSVGESGAKPPVAPAPSSAAPVPDHDNPEESIAQQPQDRSPHKMSPATTPPPSAGEPVQPAVDHQGSLQAIPVSAEDRHRTILAYRATRTPEPAAPDTIGIATELLPAAAVPASVIPPKSPAAWSSMIDSALAPGISPDPAVPLAPHRTDSLAPHTPAAPPTPASQITQAVISATDHQIELRLDPEELGRVQLILHQDGDVMRVHITADRPDTLDLLRRHVGELAQDLRAAGHEGASFSFGGSGRDQPGQRPATPLPDPDPAPRASAPPPLDHDGALDLRL